MQSFLRGTASFLLGALALLVLLEGLMRVLPVSMGLGPTPDPAAWPLHAYEPNRPYRYSYSWAMLNAHAGTTNNYGHITPQDFRSGSRPMIVVGDSFIESQMNDYADTVQGMLGSRLGADHPVYGLGISGMSASDYVVLARQTRAEFAPSAAVFLISDGDISESLLPRNGGYFLRRRGAEFVPEFVPLSPSPVMVWVRAHVGELALYAYLRNNLKFSPGDIGRAFKWGASGASHAPQSAPAGDNERDVTEWFLGELPRATGVPPQCIVLLVDADRYAIYDPKRASSPNDSPEIRRDLISRGRAMGFKVVDLGPLFRAEFAQTRTKFDFWPLDRHWSRVGHALAADAVMSALFTGAPDRACLAY